MGQYVRGVFLFTPVFKETLCFSLLETTLVFDNVIKPDAHQCLQFMLKLPQHSHYTLNRIPDCCGFHFIIFV